MSGRVWGLAGLCVALAGLLWLGPGPERAAPGAVSDPLPPLGEWQSFSVHRQGWAPIEVQREAGGWRWAGVQFAWMTGVAYGAAFVAYRVALMVGA